MSIPQSSWLPGLVVEPIDPSERLVSGNWPQDTRMPEPVWAHTAAEIAARISVHNYSVGVEESSRPLEQGFLRRLRIRCAADSPQQPQGVVDMLVDFATSERARLPDIEPWLREVYGANGPEGKDFPCIDYPGFDSGTMCLALPCWCTDRSCTCGVARRTRTSD